MTKLLLQFCTTILLILLNFQFCCTSSDIVKREISSGNEIRNENSSGNRTENNCFCREEILELKKELEELRIAFELGKEQEFYVIHALEHRFARICKGFEENDLEKVLEQLQYIRTHILHPDVLNRVSASLHDHLKLSKEANFTQIFSLLERIQGNFTPPIPSALHLPLFLAVFNHFDNNTQWHSWANIKTVAAALKTSLEKTNADQASLDTHIKHNPDSPSWWTEDIEKKIIRRLLAHILQFTNVHESENLVQHSYRHFENTFTGKNIPARSFLHLSPLQVYQEILNEFEAQYNKPQTSDSLSEYAERKCHNLKLEFFINNLYYESDVLYGNLSNSSNEFLNWRKELLASEFIARALNSTITDHLSGFDGVGNLLVWFGGTWKTGFCGNNQPEFDVLFETAGDLTLQAISRAENPRLFDKVVRQMIEKFIRYPELKSKFSNFSEHAEFTQKYETEFCFGD